MKIPLSIRPAFIGKLIKMQRAYRDRPEVFEPLCIAVKQCREFNNAETQERRDLIWNFMGHTKKHLARHGVVVG